MMHLFAAQVLAAAATPRPAASPHVNMVIQNRFGGPTYQREPALDVTSSFIAAGGGAGSFSMVRAFSSMIGAPQLQSEISNLKQKFNPDDVDAFVSIFDYAMNDAWKRLGDNNVKVSTSGSIQGRELAQALVSAGTTDSGNFYSGYLFDKLLSMRVNNQLNSDIDTKFGVLPNTTFHTIASAFFVDVAQLIGDQHAKLPKR